MIKTMFAAACIAVCCCGEPAKADRLFYTGESIYGGNSYNYGKYRTDTLRSNPIMGTEVIRDNNGNRWTCRSYSNTCKPQNNSY